MDRTVIPIRKMHCRSCEMLIERTLLGIPGITRARVSARRGEAVIESEGTLDLERVRQAIEEAGYEVGESERKLWLTRDSNEYGYLALAALLLAALFILANQSGLLTLVMSSPSTGTGLIPALLLGLTAGVSTCMALVGGLVLGVSARHAEKHPEATPLQKFRPHVFFNFGRIASFFALGGALGLIGEILVPSAVLLGILTMVIAVVMVLLGLQLTEIFPALSAYKITLPRGVSQALGIGARHEQEYTHRSAFILGALTFFLPCGFTQLMQMSAIASGGFLPGGFLMAAFALGTTPGLLGIGGLTSVVHGLGAKLFFKAAGLLVIAFAVFNLVNGYRLTGWEPFWEIPAKEAGSPRAQDGVAVENGVQIVRMDQGWDGYTPNTFTIKRGIPVRWIINASAPNSCSSALSVPSLSIVKHLKQGENVVEFTPERTGTIRFTCTMGMYPGTFTVVN